MKNQDDEIRQKAIINNATEQVRSLLEAHFADIVKAAEETFMGDTNLVEPVAASTISIKWGALSAAPKISVRIAWSMKFTDESEAEIDPLQSKLGLEPAP